MSKFLLLFLKISNNAQNVSYVFCALLLIILLFENTLPCTVLIIQKLDIMYNISVCKKWRQLFKNIVTVSVKSIPVNIAFKWVLVTMVTLSHHPFVSRMAVNMGFLDFNKN